jgi:hypothetical protein
MPVLRRGYEFELSFALADVPEVAKNFVHFAESFFAHNEDKRQPVWPWPLFARDGSSFPCYAWSTEGGRQQEALESRR